MISVLDGVHITAVDDESYPTIYIMPVDVPVTAPVMVIIAAAVVEEMVQFPSIVNGQLNVWVLATVN